MLNRIQFFYESDVIDMGFVGTKQERVLFPQQVMCFHECNPSDHIFDMFCLIQPFGEAQTMTHTGQLMHQVSDTLPPLWIMSGGTTSPAALTKVRIVDVSPCSLGTVQYWGTPVSHITSSYLGTSWHLLLSQFQSCWDLTMFRSDSTCSN